MPLFMKIKSLFRNLFRADVLEKDLDEEVLSHLEMLVDENVRKGMSPDEARRAARIELGGIDRVKDQVRDQRIGGWVHSIIADSRYGIRQLRKNLGFTATAVLTIALGIGLNSSIFTFFDASVLQPLPVKDPNTIVDVFQSTENEPGSYRSFSYAEYVALRDANSVFSDMLAYSWTQVALSTARSTNSDADQAEGLLVSENYFSVLGGKTASGTAFGVEGEQSNYSEPVVVLSHSFWQRRFHSELGTVGKIVWLNGTPFRVIGIAREEFTGTEAQIPDFWVPFMAQAHLAPSDNALHDLGSFWLQVVARLKPGVTRSAAQAGMDILINRLAKGYLGTDQRYTITLTPGALIARRDERLKIGLLAALILAAVCMIQLIACANVGNLLLARSAGRQKEIGIRFSLGATRRRVIQQLLTESSLIALLGGVVGLLLANWLPGFLVQFLQPPYENPIRLSLRIDVPVLGYTLLATMITMFVCGLAPAYRASSVDPSSAIREDTKAFGVRLNRSRLQNLFVSAEICACLLLLMSAGLLAHALKTAQSVNPGFDAKHTIVVALHLEQHGYDETRAGAFHAELTRQLQLFPGVKSVSLASLAPLGGASRAGPITVDGVSNSAIPPSQLFDYWVVSRNYFDTMGIPVVQGRSFETQDARGGRPVVIINEAMARQVWPGENAVGKRFRLGPDTVPFTEIVGVVKNTRGARLWEADLPYIYLPVLEGKKGPAIQTEQLGMKLIVRINANPSVVATAIPRMVKAIDPDISATATLGANSRDRWVWFSEVGAGLASALGLLALALAVVGILGVTSHIVAQRMQEMGLRIALGATPADVLKIVMWQGLRLSLVGGVIGLIGSITIAQVLSPVLYGVSAVDPFTLAGVSLLLVTAVLLGCYIPARRAMRVAPMLLLKHE